MNFLTTVKGSLLEDFFPEGWDLERMDSIIGRGVKDAQTRQDFWHDEFEVVPCATLGDFNPMLGHEIALEIKTTYDMGQKLAMILPVGPMGMYRWVAYFLTKWEIPCHHVHTFNMDEWSDHEGNTVPADSSASFQYAMEKGFFDLLGENTVPKKQRNFATKENLPTYAEKIAKIKAEGGRLVTVYGIGRACHIAFWEPHFAKDYASDEEWLQATHRIGAMLHPLTIEQNAITSFKSRTTLVPTTANTVGPGLYFQSDRMIGGCDGVLSRGMQWQGMSFWATLRYRPNRWVTSSYVPTIPGTLFYMSELAGPLEPESN